MKLTRIQLAILAGLLLVGAAPDVYAEKDNVETWPTVVLPEVATKIRLSNTDVNRLVCPEGIKDVVFSQEKGVKVKISDGNAFVKFQVIKKGDEMIYTEIPSEFYVVCGEDIYSLIGMPQRVPAQTVRLSTGIKKRVQQNLALFSGMPLEKKILTLIKQAYTDQLPESYVIRTIGRQIDLFPALWVRFKREIVIEGEGVAIREYSVSLKEGVEQTLLSEREFLRSELTNRPLAVAMDEPLLRKGTQSRLFIVEQRDFDAPIPFVRQASVKEAQPVQSTTFWNTEEGTDVH